MRGLKQSLVRLGWRSLTASGRNAVETLPVPELAASGRPNVTTASRSASQLWRAAAPRIAKLGEHRTVVDGFPVQFRRAFHQQYGFAAEGFLAKRCAQRQRWGQPKGMAGSGLAARAAARRKSTFAMDGKAAGHVHGAAEAYGPAAFTAGLSSGQRKQLAAWLAVCAGWVFGLVCIGGATRLTRSGLSMTDWKFTGEHRPQNEEEWELEFAKYKASPEFKRLNSTMTVDEFKYIYYWEYGHRMVGRALSLVFGLPALYFASRGMINGALGRRLALVFLMGGTQGLVGWWMVRSGLQEPLDEFTEPKVSPYRLAAHLTSAFVIYATLVLTALGVAVPHPPATKAGPEAVRAARLLGRVAHPVAALVGVTAVSGAFVAGLHAGLSYNTWPDMNGEMFPSEYFALPGLRNLFENNAAAQFNHRTLALTTLFTMLGFWRYGTQLPALHSSSRLLLHALMATTCAQVGLGIATLLTYVPVSLGTAHQAGALTLFSLMLGLLYTLRAGPSLRPFRLVLTKWATPAAVAAVAGVGGAVTQMQ